MATEEVSVQTPEITDVESDELKKSIIALPNYLNKQDKISETLDKAVSILDSLSKRMDEIEKSKAKKQDKDEDKVQINIEDDEDEKEDDMKSKKKKSDDFEARFKELEEKLSKKVDIKKEEEEAPKTPEPKEVPKIEKAKDSVEPTAPPAAGKQIKKDGAPTSFLKAAAEELNTYGSWKAIATEKMNQNKILKMEQELDMWKGMEQTRKELEDITVNTVAAPVRTLKGGVIQGGFVN